MEELLSEIADFLERHAMSEREFGIQVFNDHKFVPDLRGDGREKPRSPSLRTVEKMRAFMVERDDQQREAA